MRRAVLGTVQLMMSQAELLPPLRQMTFIQRIDDLPRCCTDLTQILQQLFSRLLLRGFKFCRSITRARHLPHTLHHPLLEVTSQMPEQNPDGVHPFRGPPPNLFVI